eukprot:5396468-Ditylum_brightwellii.AAC.1
MQQWDGAEHEGPPPSPPHYFLSAGTSKPPCAMYHVPPPPMTNQQTELDLRAELEAARKEKKSFCATYEEIAGQMMQTELAKDHKNYENYDDSLPDP